MSKTLADMTPEERAECVGMWCEIDPFGARLAIFSPHQLVPENTMIDPAYGHFEVKFEEITPRFDLPRAWTPNVQPVDMDVESETVQPHPRGGIIGPMSNPEYTDLAPGTRVRRFVTEWEQVEVDE